MCQERVYNTLFSLRLHCCRFCGSGGRCRNKVWLLIRGRGGRDTLWSRILSFQICIGCNSSRFGRARVPNGQQVFSSSRLICCSSICKRNTVQYIRVCRSTVRITRRVLLAHVMCRRWPSDSLAHSLTHSYALLASRAYIVFVILTR